MTAGYGITKQGKVIIRLGVLLRILEEFAPIAAKRANTASSEPDGFGSGSDGLTRSCDVPDPTFAAVHAGVGGVPRFDAVESAWVAASRSLTEAVAAMEAAVAQVEKILDLGEAKRGRQSSVPACLVCDGPAVPARRGMCDACRKAHERAGKPELVWYSEKVDGQRRMRLKWAGIDAGRLAS